MSIIIDEDSYQKLLSGLLNLSQFDVFSANITLFVANRVAEKVRENVPVNTGALRDTITVEQVDEQTYQVKVGSPEVPYAKYVEFGTPPHQITPQNAKVLAFEVNGQTVFTKVVNHPGFPPHPFIQPAIDEVNSEIADILVTLLKGLIEEGKTDVEEGEV